MTFKIEKAARTGFCFGVKRALEILEKATREREGVETLGAIVHNRPVMGKLLEKGVRVVKRVSDVKGDTVVISAHGVSPETEVEINARKLNLIDTTCPFVHRAQTAARRLAESDFFVVVYGESDHAEVKGILGWTKGKGMATLDEKSIASIDPLPRRLS